MKTLREPRPGDTRRMDQQLPGGVQLDDDIGDAILRSLRRILRKVSEHFSSLRADGVSSFRAQEKRPSTSVNHHPSVLRSRGYRLGGFAPPTNSVILSSVLSDRSGNAIQINYRAGLRPPLEPFLVADFPVSNDGNSGRRQSFFEVVRQEIADMRQLSVDVSTVRTRQSTQHDGWIIDLQACAFADELLRETDQWN